VFADINGSMELIRDLDEAAQPSDPALHAMIRCTATSTVNRCWAWHMALFGAPLPTRIPPGHYALAMQAALGYAEECAAPMV
jgi:hypothetical protein